MNYNIISTGSKGNAVVVNDIILIDCGIPFVQLSDVYKTIQIVLLTHQHTDHFNIRTIKRLSKERPTLRFACCKWLKPLMGDISNVDVLEIGKKYDYGHFQISPFKLYHDVPNCGYRLYMDGEKGIYATDTRTLEGITAKGYDLYMIESNYEDEEIKQRITQKQKDGIYAYEFRARDNHLSKKQCDNFLVENMSQNSNFVYLHKHEEREKC